ncbi:MAG: class I SAM-dependent methyltransferase [Pseudomonadota bacterium]
MADTRTLLEKHHGGAHFHDLMVETSRGRFSPEFWRFWDAHAAPILPARPRLLDLGTGPGLLLDAWAERYPGGEFIGVDVMPYMLDNARRRFAEQPAVRLLATDLHDPQLPLAAGSVDAASCVVVFHEMVQPIRLLQRLHGWLKPGGRLILVDWVRAGIRDYFDPVTVEALFRPNAAPDLLADRMTHFFEHNRYSPDDIAWLLEHTGFRVLGQETYHEARFVRMAAERA